MKVLDGNHFEWAKVTKNWVSGRDVHILIMRPRFPISTPEFSIRSPKTNLVIDMRSPMESKPMMFSDGVTKILVENFGWMKQDRITYWINHVSLAPNSILVVQKDNVL